MRPWKGGDAEDDLLGDGLVVGEDRGDEAALAAVGERDRVVEVVVGHDVETGPNASTSWIAGLPQRVVGVEQDRVEEGALLGVAGGDASTASGSPATISASWRSSRMRSRTSSRWSRLASAPMRVASSAGSPRAVLARRSPRAATSASVKARGAMARRMAVHFCPAFTVISRATSLTNRSNSGVPGAASGPRIEALRLSASVVKRTEFSTIAGMRLRACGRSRPSR